MIVVGAGSIGAMSLWQLSQQTNLNIIGLDAHPPGEFALLLRG